MYAQSAKKLLFMGGEFGQWQEWNHDRSLDWHLLDNPMHEGLRKWVADLNRTYRQESALHELDFDPSGFEWIDCNDSQNSTISLIRKGSVQVSGVKGEISPTRLEPEAWNPNPTGTVLIICNFTPLPRFNYRVGVPAGGFWQELLNSDASEYGGSGLGNLGGVQAEEIPYHARPYSLNITLPPLAVTFFKLC
jgi:1,4-alpha-glucan branching enzyme